MPYNAPLDEQRFVLDVIAELPSLGVDVHTSDAVLKEAAKLASEVFAPLSRIGDSEGAQLHDRRVTLPADFRGAYATCVERGWGTLSAPPEFGGRVCRWCSRALSKGSSPPPTWRSAFA